MKDFQLTVPNLYLQIDTFSIIYSANQVYIMHKCDRYLKNITY